MTIILDSGPVGLVTNPKQSPESIACKRWLDDMIDNFHEIVLPEVIDYEIRRELIRAQNTTGLDRLDDLKRKVTYLPLNTDAMLKAAEFWAACRQRHQPTANNAALDVDVILAAQTWEYTDAGEFIIVATVNKKHLAQFVLAEHWKDIHAI